MFVKRELSHSLGLQCNQMKMDLEAAKERNKLLFDNFALYSIAFWYYVRYRSSAECNVMSKETEIERCNLIYGNMML